MGNIAIRVEGISKQYHIGGPQKVYDTLVDQLTDTFTSPFRRARKVLSGQAATTTEEEFWALKDISFEIKPGEVVGVIGRNGAGKSTLLKILSQLTEPTKGFADIYGRVGSLLEVGTGFHPELTGRENIYLNGAILGMKKTEIKRKFDEIVDFSEISKFIDTPVKHYSSGMYVRLAFAVAAHLEPEILLVDEVLAVGDIAFQKKCLGKMGDVTRQGRTILFVSHNMAAIKNLCQQAIWLLDGQIRSFDDVNEVVAEYEGELLKSQNDDTEFKPIVNQEYGLSLVGINVAVVQDNEHYHLQIELQLKSLENLRSVGVGIGIHTYDGSLVSKLVPALTNNVIEDLNGECLCVLECQNIEQFLASGEYLISLSMTFPKVEVLLQAEGIASFRVPDFDHFGSGKYFTLKKYGLVPLPLKIKRIIF
jgi:lipopolysaccharide transport system ATP-binding protein